MRHVAELRLTVAPTINKAIRFLLAAQSADGGWRGHVPGSDPAVTALIARILIQHPEFGADHPDARRALAFVLKHQQPDGSIYDQAIGFANYTTSIAVATLTLTGKPEHQQAVARALSYLKGSQWAENRKDPQGVPIDTGHAWYGGAGYGSGQRPDLSNTQMMVEALHASGLPTDDPAYQKALRFIQRCQMLSQTNDQPFARGAEDGGFVYSPANGGESKAGSVEVQGRPMLRSYGSMTYAGFKSMIYAGLSRDDPRVKAAWEWIRRHYTLAANPNMPEKQSLEGLYYYYHVFAKALSAWGDDAIVDRSGKRHDWRAELCRELVERQAADGSWVNQADRWHEGNPYLVTAYAVLAIQEALR